MSGPIVVDELIERQRRLREVGRIRTGVKGGNFPKAIDTFRLTSHDRGAIEFAAKLYGGIPQPWDGHEGQWEVITKADEIPILVAPVPAKVVNEFWQAWGCARRCDGRICKAVKMEGKGDDAIFKEGEFPCICASQELTGAKACKPTTRVSVMLPELPTLGTWRLESHGYWAAVELPGAIDFLLTQAEQGRYIPATLALERRTSKSKGKTKKFVVPVIRLRQGAVLGNVLGAVGGTLGSTLGKVLEAPAMPELPMSAPDPTMQEAGLGAEDLEPEEEGDR